MIQGRHSSPGDIHQSVTSAIAESPQSSQGSRAGPFFDIRRASHRTGHQSLGKDSHEA